MNKTVIQSIISKYNLKGLIEAVKWEFKENDLIINFSSPNKDMIGKIIYNNIPWKLNSAIPIFNTSHLDKIISITENNLELYFDKKNNKLIISDGKYNIQYTIADESVIPSVIKINEGIEYDLDVILDKDIILSIIKAHNAINVDSPLIIMELEKKDLIITIGENENYSNKISLKIENINTDIFNMNKLCFDSSLLKEILNVNKTSTSSPILKINQNGLMNISFKHDELESEYYILAKQLD
jgi:hypothetical protein